MKYIRKNKQNSIEEIVPEYDSRFPGVPVSERYPRNFVSGLIAVEDDVEVEIGMIYDAATNTFYKKKYAVPPKYSSIEEAKLSKIEESKLRLASWLEHNPILYADDKYYSVTEEKQSLLNSNLASYERAETLGVVYPLKWNAVGEPCVEWTYSNLSKLSLSIAAYVAEKVAKQQNLELKIKSCTSQEELDNIIISYD